MLSPGFAAQLSTCTPITPLDSLWCIDIDTKPGACITHNATQPLSDITGGNWLDYMEQQRVFLTYAVVLPNWCKIGGVAPLIRTQTGPDPRRTKWILCLFIHLECSFTRNPIRIKKKQNKTKKTSPPPFIARLAPWFGATVWIWQQFGKMWFTGKILLDWLCYTIAYFSLKNNTRCRQRRLGPTRIPNTFLISTKMEL